MLEELKVEVCNANKSLPKHNLVIFSEGNVSAISDDRKNVVIKPSGVSYDEMTPEDMVVIDLDGNIVEGKLRPSSDTPTHIVIYKKFSEIKSIIHTHSMYATIFAQKRAKIDCLGTTHADNFKGSIPVTRELTEQEVKNDYEHSTGIAICEILDMNVPAVLVANHGPFIFGRSIKQAVNNAAVLEKIAFMALHGGEKLGDHLLEKHHSRKHGAGKYYGQK